MIAYLGLGSNLGDGRSNLLQAIALLKEQVGAVKAISTFIESEPWGFESEHRFTNAVVAVEAVCTPMELLELTQAIERQMGRTHKHQPGESYTDRIIDIDILLFGDCHVATAQLTIPHPLINERDFVKVPLAECQQLVDLS